MDIERTKQQPVQPYLKIAHSIFEQLMVSQFSLRQWRIVLLVMRLSWACGKTTAFILQRDFGVVGVGECHIKAAIDSLIEAGVVIRRGRYYSFNTDFEKWQVQRAPGYEPRKLSQLVCLNLKVGDPRESFDLPIIQATAPNLAKSESPDFLKRKVMAYRNGKFAAPDLASAKERLNKYINIHSEFGDTEAPEIWKKVLDRLRPQVNTSNYATWLSQTHGLICRDHILTISVPNSFVAQYLGSNLRSLIEKTIIDLTGVPYQIAFETESE